MTTYSVTVSGRTSTSSNTPANEERADDKPSSDDGAPDETGEEPKREDFVGGALAAGERAFEFGGVTASIARRRRCGRTGESSQEPLEGIISLDALRLTCDA